VQPEHVVFSVTANDNCSGVTVVKHSAKRQHFSRLGTERCDQYCKSDASGNQATCTFTVNTFAVTVKRYVAAGDHMSTNLYGNAPLGGHVCSRM